MERDRIRFGVDLDRKTDSEFEEIARTVEGRSKRNMHQILIRRVVRIWKSNPEALRQIRLIQD